VLASAPPAAAGGAPTTFTYTGSEQTYTVPAGMNAVTITVVGAPGGPAGVFSNNSRGLGAQVTATVPVAGGSTLYVEVGGVGTGTGGGCGSTTVLAGGFNGGGSGSGCGAGGGGASDVRTTSIVTVPDSALTHGNDSRLVVAGGGGGFGSCTDTSVGGAAGDATATGPGNGGGHCLGGGDGNGGNAGFGGSAGGTGGIGSGLGRGADGVLGDGVYGGGGGGGGYYGGGGGGGDAGNPGTAGGAGSSFWTLTATDTSMSEDTTGTPEVQITPLVVARAGGGPRGMVCLTAPHRRADGSVGLFFDLDAATLAAGINDPSSIYYQATPAIYVKGYGTMCQISDLVTYGGNPANYSDTGIKVNEAGQPTPAGVDPSSWGADYEYYIPAG
jgi:hypothetical protein